VRRFVVVSVLLLAPSSIRAAPLGPADRASAETAISALGADPFAEEPLRALERIYLRGPGLPALIAECNRRVSGEPTSFAWRVVLGRVEIEHGPHANGLHALEQAIDLRQDSAAARRLGRMLDDLGDHQGALRAYRAGLADASVGEKRALLLRIGTIILNTGKIAEAQATWAEANRLEPRDPSLRRQMAEALAAHGAFREAIAELVAMEPLLEREPLVLVAVLRREADFARRAGDLAHARAALVRAYLVAAHHGQSALRAELTLDLLRSYGQRTASAAARSRELSELVLIAERAAREDPRATALVGDALASRGEHDKAVATFRRALAAQPDDAYVLRRLAALSTGDERIQALVSLFGVERSDATLGLDLVTALLDAGRTDEGLRYARTFRDRMNDNPTVLAELGALLTKKRQPTEAVAVDERVLALDPDQPDAAIAYGDALRTVGRKDDATKAYFRLVGRDASTVSYHRLIEVLTARKLIPEVKRAYQDALARSPDDHPLRRDYARWLTSNGAPDESIVEWKKLQDRASDAFLRELATREINRLERKKLLDR
jgi:tetratricopeptide (TPR) repeat protein